jgi:hypothetical protein
MCAVRLAGLGRGDGTAGVVRTWSPVAGAAGGVVMAGVLAHHLLVAGAVRGLHYSASTVEKLLFTPVRVIYVECVGGRTLLLTPRVSPGEWGPLPR